MTLIVIPRWKSRVRWTPVVIVRMARLIGTPWRSRLVFRLPLRRTRFVPWRKLLLGLVGNPSPRSRLMFILLVFLLRFKRKILIRWSRRGVRWGVHMVIRQGRLLCRKVRFRFTIRTRRRIRRVRLMWRKLRRRVRRRLLVRRLLRLRVRIIRRLLFKRVPLMLLIRWITRRKRGHFLVLFIRPLARRRLFVLVTVRRRSRRCRWSPRFMMIRLKRMRLRLLIRRFVRKSVLVRVVFWRS